MNEVRLYNILQSVRVTEKGVTAAEKYRQHTFKVANHASKTDIKQAVEKIFSVVVEAVRIINVKGKSRQFRQQQGKKSDWKKALVTLKAGHDINFAEFK